MRWKIVALVLLISLSGMQLAFADNRAIKATTPVEVSIYPVTSVAQGKVATFTVYATTSIPSENFVIEVTPSEGSELIAGDLSWQGHLMPGQAHELSITLRMARDSVPSVTVASGIQQGGVVRFAASATYRQQAQTPVAVKSFSRERKAKRKGRQVIEYRVK